MKHILIPRENNRGIQLGRLTHPGCRVLFLLGLAMLVSSCSSSLLNNGSQATPIETPKSTAAFETRTSNHTTETSTVVPTIQQVSTQAPTTPARACLKHQGSVESLVLEDDRLFRDMPFRVYLPPCYAADPEQHYPTLYLLHGLQSTDSQWDELGVDEAADSLISEGALPPFLIVMPWHRTGIDLITAVPEILVPYIETNYAANQVRSNRAIGGLSLGGGQALEIGLRYPELFASIGMHSPAVAYADSIIIDWASSIPAPVRPAMWLDIGERDSLYPAAQSLIDELQAKSIPINIQINEGDHLAEYWSSHLKEYLLWYGSNWQ